ncbi:relaxin-3-like isoform X2 [Lissotriton helveticus]
MLKLKALWHLVCVGLLVADFPGHLNAQGAGGRPGAGASDFAVRLCGREFIRAVIFTCGGSRWKRLTLDVDSSQGARDQLQQSARRSLDPVQGTSTKDLDTLKLQTFLGPDMEQHQLPSANMPFERQPIKDLFDAYVDYSENVPVSEDFNEYIRQAEEAAQKPRGGVGSSLPGASDRLPWINYPRRKRDYSMGVAGMCCKWGCTKAEISTLC